MKKGNVLSGLILAFVFSSFIASAFEIPKNEKITYKMPNKVKAVFENNCYGCHNTDARSDKAKDKLNFDTLEGLSKVDKIGAFNHITKVLEEGKMPPEKFLAMHPEKKLTSEETLLLTEWVKKESHSLLKK